MKLNFIFLTLLGDCLTRKKEFFMKEIGLSLATLMFSVLASGQSLPQLTDLARKQDGSVLIMTQGAAELNCQAQGQHLPSARELAQFAQSIGAAGISETKISEYLRFATKRYGHVDAFYYSKSGYGGHLSGFGGNRLWTSSEDLHNSDYALVFGSVWGEFGYLNRYYDYSAFVCLK